MVERANNVRSVCAFYVDGDADRGPLTAADLPASLYPICGPTWRHLHFTASDCRYLMHERFAATAVSLTITGDVARITTAP